MGTNNVGGPQWDLDSFTISEPDQIVEAGAPFNISVVFHGSGSMWTGMENSGAQFVYSVFAEGIGLATPEVDFTPITANLTSGGSPYTVILPASLAQVGVYRLACTVTFPLFPGVVGHLENLLIQVY